MELYYSPTHGGFFMITRYKLLLAVSMLLLLPAIGGPTGKSDEETIRDLDKEWSRAAENKDAAKFATFYSKTGSALPFNAPMATGRAEVQELWTSLMAKPGFALHFAPTRIVVSRSEDIAYDIGTFELKLDDAQGAPMTIPGKYVVAWAKQKNGEWKAEADCFNTDK
jgi:ketosteroid isomerase-like protein